MRVLIDIAHPAHVHYFRNFAKLFDEKGHKCIFTLRDKGIIVDIARKFDLNYKIRSVERKSKIKYLIESSKNIYKIAREFKPDFFLDMGSVSSAPVSKLFRKPYLAFDDTEVSVKARLLHMPFTDIILTPKAFYKDLGQKQIRFDSYMELMYLNPKYFTPNIEFIKNYIIDFSNFVLIRFVSWEAHHDVGNYGISYERKIELVEYLKNKYQILISSEGPLPTEFEKYRNKVPNHLIHHVLSFAKFVVTEGATMASESFVLRTPVIYINSIQNGYSLDQSKNGLFFGLNSDENLISTIEKLEKIIANRNEFLEISASQSDYIKSKIDLTEFAIWFIDNYPESKRIIEENPDYQYNFK
jgi:uncharacterized protein